MTFILWNALSNQIPEPFAVIEFLEMAELVDNDIVHEVLWQEHEFVAEVEVFL